MLSRQDILAHREAILAAASRHGASDVRLFGSVARGEEDEASDVDLIVRFESDRSLLDLGGLLIDLEELLGVKVDVVPEDALSGRFAQIALAEAIPV